MEDTIALIRTTYDAINEIDDFTTLCSVVDLLKQTLQRLSERWDDPFEDDAIEMIESEFLSLLRNIRKTVGESA